MLISSAVVGIAVIKVILPQQYIVLALIFNAINLLSIFYIIFFLVYSTRHMRYEVFLSAGILQ